MDWLQMILFVLVGFAAQIIDGALGMAYGVSSNTFLLSLGLPPAIASASVHAAEMFTTAISGLSHLKLGNVDKDLVKKLIIPGVIGGVLGAYILTALPGDQLKPFISAYLLIMGVVILVKAYKKATESERQIPIIPLGLIGGFFDAIGGGGWGPVVTTTLVAGGKQPRFAIGSVNAAEFFVTISESAAFIVLIGKGMIEHWEVIIGLLTGGMLAAPCAAWMCKRIPPRALMTLVGVVIIVLSLRTIYLALV